MDYLLIGSKHLDENQYFVKKHVVYLSLGTNLGERLENLNQALDRLTIFCNVTLSSSVYETDPWGFEAQPIFYNQVVRIETDLEPLALLEEIKRIEFEMGRVPTFQYGPRLIDIDILLYDKLTMISPELKIPHPQMKSRAFVLSPLAEIAPDLVIPGEEVDIVTLYRIAGSAGIHKVKN
jgi:2-amino-4-hydroxy-6-hydroxymethyldihydropteridine diphosphokinase